MQWFFIHIIILFNLLACQPQKDTPKTTIMQTQEQNPETTGTAQATFGGGCFWCTEAIFDRLEGVISVESGYAGGFIKNPAYREVCTGDTGHAEVIHIVYNPAKISYEFLLEVFFNTHDPTTLNRQGADVGTQYRSVVFYHDEKQRDTAQKLIKKFNTENAFGKPVVTAVEMFNNYYKAEDYHQDYYANNPNQGYCNFVISGKVSKFEKRYHAHLKPEYK